MSTNNFRKPFDPKLYKENDSRAKKACKAVFKSLGVAAFKGAILTENLLSEFAADLMVIQKTSPTTLEIVGMIETEVKMSWKGSKYPFDTVRIPERKLKFVGSHWMIWNADCTTCAYIPAEVVGSAPITFVENKYSKGEAEAFITVDVKDVRFINEELY